MSKLVKLDEDGHDERETKGGDRDQTDAVPAKEVLLLAATLACGEETGSKVTAAVNGVVGDILHRMWPQQWGSFAVDLEDSANTLAARDNALELLFEFGAVLCSDNLKPSQMRDAATSWGDELSGIVQFVACSALRDDFATAGHVRQDKLVQLLLMFLPCTPLEFDVGAEVLLALNPMSVQGGPADVEEHHHALKEMVVARKQALAMKTSQKQLQSSKKRASSGTGISRDGDETDIAADLLDKFIQELKDEDQTVSAGGVIAAAMEQFDDDDRLKLKAITRERTNLINELAAGTTMCNHHV